MSQRSHLNGAPSQCSIRLIRRRFAYKEVRVLALDLILPFSCELWPSSLIPTNFDDTVRDVKGDMDSIEFPW
ncbi:hypothetical protein Tco_1067617 [Tanacetum coccineum]|uniref:Uncharacterized protein n=1 Tax=Tanacetum coccineum TaxID=301880 RepID=A0ABQ5HDZ5_9ASTR